VWSVKTMSAAAAEQKLAVVTAELEAKQIELEELKQSFDEYVESSKDLETELEASLEDVEEKLREATDKNKVLDTKIADLYSQLSNATSEQDRLNDSLTKSKNSLDTANLTIRKLEQSNAAMEDKIRELELTEKDLKGKLDASVEAGIHLQVELDAQGPDKANEEVKKLKAELAGAQAELLRVEGELNDYKEREKNFADKEKEWSRKLGKATYFEEELSRARSQIGLLEARVQQRTQEKVALESEVTSLRESLPDKSAKKTSVRASSKEHEAVDGFEAVVEDLYARLGEAEEENRELTDALEVAQEDLMRKHEAFVEVNKANTTLEEKLKKTQEDVFDLEKQLEASKSKLASANEHIQTLKKKLDQKSLDINGLNASNRELVSENEGLVKRMNSLAEEATIQNQTQYLPPVSDADIIADLKKAEAAWQIERAELIRERDMLRVEVVELEERLNEEATPIRPVVAVETASISNSEVAALIDTTGRARLAAEQAIESEDINMMKEELMHQLHRYDHMRANNAILLHKLQSAKGNIQVCCRTRPPSDQELGQGAKICLDVVGETELACFDKRTHMWRTFHFDKVWDEDATQADVFADIEPLALSVVDGFNSCIFAYGQTGSGKTFTMNGYGTDYGVSYRTLHKIFELLNLKKRQAELYAARLRHGRTRTRHGRAMSSNLRSSSVQEPESGDISGLTSDSECDFTEDELVETLNEAGASKLNPCESRSSIEGYGKRESTDSIPPYAPPVGDDGDSSFSFSVEVSMLEIYNETVKDLLVAPGHASVGLDIRHDADGRINVPGLTKETVTCLEDVMEVFARGSANRATTATNLNEHSSRSHSILCVHVTTTSNDGMPVTGKLYLVDLAGSERMDKSGVTGQAMKETQHINKSLSALGDVMEGLDKKSKHVPYRNSKLTYLLQDSLGGNSRTMMIVTVCPTELTTDETLFALQFATRARNIQLGTAKRNVSWKALEESLKNTRKELAEARRQKQQAMKMMADLKKDSKRTQEKMSNQMDTKIRNIDETRKGAEVQIDALTRTNAELLSRLQEEKESHRLASAEVENMQKALKKAQESMKVVRGSVLI